MARRFCHQTCGLTFQVPSSSHRRQPEALLAFCWGSTSLRGSLFSAHTPSLCEGQLLPRLLATCRDRLSCWSQALVQRQLWQEKACSHYCRPLCKLLLGISFLLLFITMPLKWKPTGGSESGVFGTWATCVTELFKIRSNLDFPFCLRLMLECLGLRGLHGSESLPGGTKF